MREIGPNVLDSVDADPATRPGVPMQPEPHRVDGAAWTTPDWQPGAERHLHRVELETATPVFGTGQPLHGVSGRLRRLAYRIPEHFARHWLLLLFADRVDVLEDRIGRPVGSALRRAGLAPLARPVERDPITTLALLAGAAILLRASRRR